MIVVHEMVPGMFARVNGNPVILSLDGETQAPLLTILAPSWTEEDRAKYGVYLVEPVVVPPGKVIAGEPFYERVDGVVVEKAMFMDEPPTRGT